MSRLDDIIAANGQQMTLDEYMAIEDENGDGNGFHEGQPVGHADFADFRAIFVGHGQDGKALVRVVAGWTCAPPAWPVSVPLGKLVEI